MQEQKNLRSRVGQAVCVQTEAVPTYGEDAYVTATKDGLTLLGVFDGCGGLGAKKYPNCDNRTAANIAARCVSAAAESWFERTTSRLTAEKQCSVGVLSKELKHHIDLWLELIKNKLDSDEYQLIGSLVRSFPTTISMVTAECFEEQKILCKFFWAGDSRGYLLTPNGLRQITRDDLRSEGDAFENLYEDSPLSNLISGDGLYEIHGKTLSVSFPAILLAATDGAFSYLPSPMHFEQLLLETLCHAKDENEWKQTLTARFAEIAGDDSTLLMACFGWETFSELKKDFAARHQEMTALLEKAETQDDLRTVWSAYKLSYEHYLE